MNGRGGSPSGRPRSRVPHSAALCPHPSHTHPEEKATQATAGMPPKEAALHKAQAPRRARAALAGNCGTRGLGWGWSQQEGEREAGAGAVPGLGSFCTRGGLCVRGTFCENVRNNLASGRKAISRTQRKSQVLA